MDALHLLNDLNTETKWSKVRLVALTGTPEMVQDGVTRIKDRAADRVVQHIHADDLKDVYEVISQTDVNAEPRLYVVHDLLENIDEADVLRLTRLTKKNYFSTLVVLTGDKLTEEAKNVFGTSTTAVKSYHLDFKNTDVGQTRLVQWITSVTQCARDVALKIVAVSENDIIKVLRLTQKIRAFEGVTPQDVDLLAIDYYSDKFAVALLNLNYVEAMTIADKISEDHVVRIVSKLVTVLNTLGEIHPLTRQVKQPTKQQAIDSKLLLRTIQQWWHVAGRYPPDQQIRRHMLLVETVHRYYTRSKEGLLVHLVMQW